MIISLIGFSSTGKSYWAKRLGTELGFDTLCCDDLIEEKLKEAGIFDGSGIRAVANWMGMPYDEGFAEKEQQYLSFEKEVMDQLFQILNDQQSSRPIVIDTTGSVIYTGESRCQKLQELGQVVYLDVDQQKIDQMLENFISRPKPIVWNNTFTQHDGESQQEALKRSYRELLFARADLYKKYAGVTIPYQIHKEKNLSSREFIEMISSH